MDCTVISNKKISDFAYDMRLEAPGISVIPGQFAAVYCTDQLLLRRPISICQAGENSIRLVYEVRGKGTEFLSKVAPGQTLDVLAPLGNGFEGVAGKKILLLGGGIGVPPLLGLAKVNNCDAVLGFRDKSRVILDKEFEQVCGQVLVCTDDGSYGHCGTVEKSFLQMLAENEYDLVVACGPVPLLKLAAGCGVKALVSVEQRMGCCIGACMVCVCQTVHGYKFVCKDGPVFSAEQVVFE